MSEHELEGDLGTGDLHKDNLHESDLNESDLHESVISRGTSDKNVERGVIGQLKGTGVGGKGNKGNKDEQSPTSTYLDTEESYDKKRSTQVISTSDIGDIHNLSDIGIHIGKEDDTDGIEEYGDHMSQSINSSELLNSSLFRNDVSPILQSAMDLLDQDPEELMKINSKGTKSEGNRKSTRLAIEESDSSSLTTMDSEGESDTDSDDMGSEDTNSDNTNSEEGSEEYDDDEIEYISEEEEENEEDFEEENDSTKSDKEYGSFGLSIEELDSQLDNEGAHVVNDTNMTILKEETSSDMSDEKSTDIDEESSTHSTKEGHVSDASSDYTVESRDYTDQSGDYTDQSDEASYESVQKDTRLRSKHVRSKRASSKKSKTGSKDLKRSVIPKTKKVINVDKYSKMIPSTSSKTDSRKPVPKTNVKVKVHDNQEKTSLTPTLITDLSQKEMHELMCALVLGFNADINTLKNAMSKLNKDQKQLCKAGIELTKRIRALEYSYKVLEEASGIFSGKDLQIVQEECEKSKLVLSKVMEKLGELRDKSIHERECRRILETREKILMDLDKKTKVLSTVPNLLTQFQKRQIELKKILSA